MSVQKTPTANLRRRYPLYAEVGLALALALAVLAFTVPTEPPAPPVAGPPTDVPFDVTFVPPTVEAPPPPPPPAPPPPVEVEGEVEDEEILPDIEFDPDAFVAPPSRPPAPPAFTPTQEIPAPPAPQIDIAEEDEDIIVIPEVEPTLIGGLEGLQSRVEYPQFARQAGIEGQVVIQFVVDERGNVVDPVVLRSPNDLLSEAALKAVRESRFTPGQQRGRPVKVRFAVPVTFRLR